MGASRPFSFRTQSSLGYPQSGGLAGVGAHYWKKYIFMPQTLLLILLKWTSAVQFLNRQSGRPQSTSESRNHCRKLVVRLPPPPLFSSTYSDTSGQLSAPHSHSLTYLSSVLRTNLSSRIINRKKVCNTDESLCNTYRSSL